MQKRQQKEHSAPVTALIIIGKSLLLLPILAAMAYINYTVDVSGVFHSAQYEEDTALALLGGQAVDHYDQMDERGVIQQVANNTETPFNTLSFGSSRVLQLREDIADGGQFFNVGVSGADFVDITGLFYRFEQAQMKPDTVILSLEHWWLSASYYDAQERSDKNLYNEFLYVDLGHQTEFEPEEEETFRYDVLLSPSYMQGNLAAYADGGRQYEPPSIVSENLYEQETNIKLHDGSILYSEDYRTLPQEERNTLILNQAVDFIWVEEFRHLDEERCAVFDEYVQYLLSQDIQVIFVIAPYHPTIYTHLLEYPDYYSGFFETEPFYTDYALEHNIPLYGSFNPFVTGTPDEGFYDGTHMKDAYWQDFFPGVEEALEQMQTSEAYSPWILGDVRVQEDIAQSLVVQRYEIGAQEHLEREEDEEILGETCYVFSRYGLLPTSADEVQLARYAVTQNEGVIYRYDTTTEEWVVDRRNYFGESGPGA